MDDNVTDVEKVQAAAQLVRSSLDWADREALKRSQEFSATLVGWLRKRFNTADVGHADNRLNDLERIEIDYQRQWRSLFEGFVARAAQVRLDTAERIADVIEHNAADKKEGKKLAALIRAVVEPTERER